MFAQEEKLLQKDEKLQLVEQNLENLQHEFSLLKIQLESRTKQKKEDDRKIVCSKCTKREFKTERGLLRHILDKHIENV